ncbi:MAG TPA: WXG100 family type VII secretion target, partial [Actinocrinis sp.]
MSGSAPFNEGVVQQNGGVAWAKQQGQVLETVPDAIDSQIAGYKAAIQQLQQVHTSVTNGSTQLQSAWSGSASDAATSAFSDTA